MPFCPPWFTKHGPPPPPPPSPSGEDEGAVLRPAVQECLRDLLSKYSNGVWTHALPKLFLDAYKMVFPEEVLAQLSLLRHLCCVEYPAPHDRTKVIADVFCVEQFRTERFKSTGILLN